MSSWSIRIFASLVVFLSRPILVRQSPSSPFLPIPYYPQSSCIKVQTHTLHAHTHTTHHHTNYTHTHRYTHLFTLPCVSLSLASHVHDPCSYHTQSPGTIQRCPISSHPISSITIPGAPPSESRRSSARFPPTTPDPSVQASPQPGQCVISRAKNPV